MMLLGVAVLVSVLAGAEGCAGLLQSAKKIQAPPRVAQVAKKAVPKPPPRPASTNPADPLPFRYTGKALSDHLGPLVKTAPYSGKGYVAKGGGPSTELGCDFEGAQCCWANPGLPTDQLDWVLASGPPNQALLLSQLAASEGPAGGYLALGTGPVAAADEAQLLSCSVQCSGPLSVSLRHWQTYEALVQVCTKSSLEPDAPLLNCQELPREASPGPTTLDFPASQLFDVVIVASNLVEESGNVVLIDDVEVSLAPCDGPAEVAPPSGGDDEYGIDDSEYGQWGDEDDSEPPINGGLGGLVPSVLSSAKVAESAEYPTEGGLGGLDYDSEGLCSAACSFEDGSSCGFVSARGEGFDRDFAVAKRRFKNRATGIRRPGQGRSFAAVFLRPGSQAGLQATFAPSAGRVEVQFKYYEVTQGVQFSACCGSEADCPVESDLSVSVGDRDWKSAAFSCPPGTRRLLFLCRNRENNQGACGVDDIRIDGC